MTPVAKRGAAGFLVKQHSMSIASACRITRFARSSYYRAPIDWIQRDAPIREALKALLEHRPNRGFWKCRKQLKRQGHDWNHKRIYRIYTAMGLNLRRKAKKRLPKREHASLYVPPRPNVVWSADFVSDSLICGKRFRLFNVIDDFNRECVHIEVDTSITSRRLVKVFEQLEVSHGLPEILRTDNGPEFLGEIFVDWLREKGVILQYIQPGKPNQNAYIERFNLTMREDLLDPNLFLRVRDVREGAYWFAQEYNEERPHDSLQDMTPKEVKENYVRNSTLDLSLK
jgi:putative transposase